MSELAIRTLPDENARKLARALKKRAPDLQCRVCGHSDFALLEDPNAQMRTHLRREAVHKRYGVSFEPMSQTLLTLVCTHCGHLEQFAEAVLEGATPNQYGLPVNDE
jgi:hypothetical protein